MKAINGTISASESTSGDDVGVAAESDKLVGSDRVLAVLTELAQHPDGIALEDLSRTVRSPKSTTHRALAALRRAGFASRNTRGHYVLGDKLLRLAFTHYEARPDHLRMQTTLQALVDEFHETVHYTVLDGRSVVYRAKVDPAAGAIRLTSVIGGSNPAHLTAAGKLLLSYRLPDEAAVRRWIESGPLEKRTDNSKVTATELHQELARTRERGYGVDDQENEVGVNCLAIPVFLGSPATPTGAVSISAVAYRTPVKALIEAVPHIRQIMEERGTT
jgi:IclR family transcriptional regulator, acetate operon repressor